MNEAVPFYKRIKNNLFPKKVEIDPLPDVDWDEMRNFLRGSINVKAEDYDLPIRFFPTEEYIFILASYFKELCLEDALIKPDERSEATYILFRKLGIPINRSDGYVTIHGLFNFLESHTNICTHCALALNFDIPEHPYANESVTMVAHNKALFYNALYSVVHFIVSKDFLEASRRILSFARWLEMFETSDFAGWREVVNEQDIPVQTNYWINCRDAVELLSKNSIRSIMNLPVDLYKTKEQIDALDESNFRFEMVHIDVFSND